MTTINLGKIKPLHKGAYETAITYRPLDFTTYLGNLYVCKATSTGNLPTNTTYFDPVVDLTAATDAYMVGFQQAGTGAVSTTVQRKLRERVSVKDFGAVGDGVTDDTAAFVAAAATGALVEVPPGQFILSNSAFPSVFRIRGAGMGRTSLRWKAASAESNMIALYGVVDVHIEGLTIDGNRQNQTDSAGYYGAIGGTLGDGASVVIEGVEFKNGRISDIYMNGPTGEGEQASVRIDGCRFTDGMVGTGTRSAQAIALSEGISVRLTNNEFSQPTIPAAYGRGGLIMQRPPASTSLSWSDIVAIGNRFRKFGRGTADTIGCIYVYSGVRSVIISDNHTIDSIGNALCVKADCGMVVVTNNVIINHRDTWAPAIVVFDQAANATSSLGENFIISGNVLKNTQHTGIMVDGARVGGRDDARNFIISNNIIDGAVRGIHYRNLSTISVRGNLISNTSSVAIFAQDQAGDCVIQGNTITGGLVGFDCDGDTSAARINVSDNVISNLTATAIRIKQSVASFSIDRNRFNGCGLWLQTTGATGLSVVLNNVVTGETSNWAKTGTYSTLVYDRNVVSVSLSYATRSLTVDSGQITPLADWHWVDTEGGAATDDLVTINGGYEGRRLILFATSSARDVVLKSGAGNLRLAGDFTLTHADDSIELIFRNNAWVEIGRSDNAA